VSDRESLVDRLTGGIGGQGDDPRAAQFVRGLALGALVGAAIAGSTLWQRRRTAAGRAPDAETAAAAAVSPAEPIGALAPVPTAGDAPDAGEAAPAVDQT
jgi:hypothetical protein